MASFVVDTFTEAAGTVALASHVADVGGTWTKHASYTGNGQVNAATDRCYTNSIAVGVYYHSGIASTADYDVQVDVFNNTADANLDQAGVCARVDTAANTMYRAYARWGTNDIKLEKVVAGAVTSLGTFSVTMPADQASKVLKLECRDALKTVSWDGSTAGSSADNAITATGKAGLYLNSDAGGLAGALNLDNFLAADPPAVLKARNYSILQAVNRASSY